MLDSGLEDDDCVLLPLSFKTGRGAPNCCDSRSVVIISWVVAVHFFFLLSVVGDVSVMFFFIMFGG